MRGRSAPICAASTGCLRKRCAWKSKFGGVTVSDTKRWRICRPQWACRSGGPAPLSVRIARWFATNPGCPPDTALHTRLRPLANAYRRFGYRRPFVLLHCECEPPRINRIYRPYREEGLTVRKRRRPAQGGGNSGRRVAPELLAIIERRGKSGMIVSGNGTELTSNAILDRCAEQWIEWQSIAPDKPVQNGLAESFNGPMRNDG